jgi:hypothetical protein
LLSIAFGALRAGQRAAELCSDSVPCGRPSACSSPVQLPSRHFCLPKSSQVSSGRGIAYLAAKPNCLVSDATLWARAAARKRLVQDAERDILDANAILAPTSTTVT